MIMNPKPYPMLLALPGTSLSLKGKLLKHLELSFTSS